MTRARSLLFVIVGGLSVAANAHGRGNDDAPDEKPTHAEQAVRLTLADRIPSVTQRKYAKDGKVELNPVLGLSLSDAFFRHVEPGVGFNYYLFETLALGLSAEYYASIKRTPQIVGSNGLPSPEVNRPQYSARLQALWVPFYGKVSWFAEAISHLDMYLGAHVGINGMQYGGAAPVLGFAIGQHHYINERMALRLEVRNDFFKASRNIARPDDKVLESQLAFFLGVSFYLPGLGPN